MSRRWALFERVPAPDVNNPATDHMVRWRLVQTPWFGVYIHRINTPDDTRPIPHTHPWPFVSLVVRGGCTERIERHYRSGLVRFGERTRRAGSVHMVRTIDAHTITALRRSPTWTFVVVGRRRREPSWGYWDRYRFTPWNEHTYAQAFAAALQTHNVTTAQDRPPAGDETRTAPPWPVDTTGPRRRSVSRRSGRGRPVAGADRLPSPVQHAPGTPRLTTTDVTAGPELIPSSDGPNSGSALTNPSQKGGGS